MELFNQLMRRTAPVTFYGELANPLVGWMYQHPAALFRISLAPFELAARQRDQQLEETPIPHCSQDQLGSKKGLSRWLTTKTRNI
jgi:hypothetical protein